MKKVIIIGGKGTAVVIAEQILDASERYGCKLKVEGFAFDDPAFRNGINGWPVLCGTREAYPKYKDDPDVFFLFSMFRSDKIRERGMLCESYGVPIERWLTFIHPSSIVCKSAKIGPGTVILANSVINSNVEIGRNTIIQASVVVEHDTRIGDYNFLSAHSCLGSEIRIGKYNFIGLNSTVRTFVEIGENNIIGMGSVVLNNYGNNMVIVGNPAKPLRNNLS
ncbi:MAG: sialic acid O-acetyltransferase [Muribaculaceae bacterium]|nr:sialic acid O-acetyltransferase [Muribaculaceae bacterium]